MAYSNRVLDARYVHGLEPRRSGMQSDPMEKYQWVYYWALKTQPTCLNQQRGIAGKFLLIRQVGSWRTCPQAWGRLARWAFISRPIVR